MMYITIFEQRTKTDYLIFNRWSRLIFHYSCLLYFLLSSNLNTRENRHLLLRQHKITTSQVRQVVFKLCR